MLLINLDGLKTTNIGLFFENATTIVKSIQQEPKHTQKTKFSKMLRNPKLAEATRDEYHLTAKNGDLHSQTVSLNGKELVVNSSGIIPLLEPIKENFSSPITVAPFSIVFVHIPSIHVHKILRIDCFHDLGPPIKTTNTPYLVQSRCSMHDFHLYRLLVCPSSKNRLMCLRERKSSEMHCLCLCSVQNFSIE